MKHNDITKLTTQLKELEISVSEWLLDAYKFSVVGSDGMILLTATGKSDEPKRSKSDLAEDVQRMRELIKKYGRSGPVLFDLYAPELIVELGILDQFSNDQFKVQGHVDDNGDLIITLIPRDGEIK